MITVALITLLALTSPLAPAAPLPDDPFFLAPERLPLAANEWPAGLADIDGDGILDALLTGAPYQASELLFLRGQGDGSFDAPVLCATGSSLHAPAILVQWDGDAALEAAWVQAGVLEVFDFDGSCFSQPLSLGTFPSETYITKLFAADLDGDGLDELVLHDQWTRRAFIVESVGGAPTTTTTLLVPQPLGPGFSTLALGDIEGDGDADLVTTSLFDGGLSGAFLSATLFANNGTGSFVAQPTATVPVLFGNPSVYGPELQLVDWDGDGLQDLLGKMDVWPNTGGGGGNGIVYLFPNLGGGAFGAPGLWPDASVKDIAGVEDLDGDGLPELVSWVVVRGDGAFDVHISAPFYGSLPSDLVHDVDGDGDIDLHSAGVVTPFASYWANDGSGVFTAQLVAPTLAIPPTDFMLKPARGDFDEDGQTELIVEHWRDPIGLLPPFFLGLRRLADAQGTGYVDIGPAAEPNLQWIDEPTLSADIDGDGHLDIADAGSLWYGDGSGGFSAPVTLFNDGWILATGDVEPDGDVDLLAIRNTPSGAQMHLYRANDGSFVSELIEAQSSVWTRPGLFDLDGDGDLDAVMHRSLAVGLPDEALQIYENVGAGFVRHDYGPLTLLASASDMAQEDVDGDGLDDLLLLANSPSQGTYASLLVARRIGPGVDVELHTYLVVQGSGLADGDADGDIDVIGGVLTPNLRVNAPDGGGLRQYGAGTPGTGLAVPLLGATGPLVAGSDNASVRMLRGLGGAPVYVVLGAAEATLAGAPKPTTTFYVGGSPLVFVPLVLAGTPGAPGTGTLTLPFDVAPSIAGLTAYAQFFVLDPNVPFGVSASNGLELNFAP